MIETLEEPVGSGTILTRSASLDLLGDVLESSTECSIIVTDTDGEVLVWNEGARRMYRYEPEDAVGVLNLSQIYGADEGAEGNLKTVLDLVRRHGKWEGDVPFRRRDGKAFFATAAFTLRRAKKGAPAGFLIIAQDCTQRHRLEEELRNKNEELQQMFKHAVHASRVKTQFLARVSHELRTPLNGIIGFSEVLIDGHAGPLNDTQKEYQNDVLASARLLLRLIDDLLDVARVESGKVEFRPEEFLLSHAVHEVYAGLQPMAAKKHQSVVMTFDPEGLRVVLDPTRLKQVVYNLLSNAIKFTPEGGRIRVRVRPCEEPGQFILEVQDNGVGIRKEDMNRLFHEFQRVEGSEKQDGFGLGLAVTRRMVQQMGGRISVGSEVGRGSVFRVRLPVHPSSGPASGEGLDHPPGVDSDINTDH